MPELVGENREMLEGQIVRNMDVRFCCDKLARFCMEVQRSASSNQNIYTAADQLRLESYLDAIDTAHAWASSDPPADLPKTHPRDYKLEDFPPGIDADNEAVNLVQDLLKACWLELAHGQSADMASGMQEHDSVRVTDTIERCRRFLTDYIAVVQPLDQPESTPHEPLTGQGTSGRGAQSK